MASAKRRGGEADGDRAATTGESAAPSFEAALASLEGVVARLENGDMPLEAALEAFEAGVKLSRQCAATLDAAERRIEILVAERGGVRVEPFDRRSVDGADGGEGPVDGDAFGGQDDEEDAVD